MRGLRGVAAGALSLIALHTLVAYKGPSKRIQDLVGRQGILTGFVDKFLDPTRPAIPGKPGWADDLFNAPRLPGGGGGGGTRQQVTQTGFPSAGAAAAAAGAYPTPTPR